MDPTRRNNKKVVDRSNIFAQLGEPDTRFPVPSRTSPAQSNTNDYVARASERLKLRKGQTKFQAGRDGLVRGGPSSSLQMQMQMDDNADKQLRVAAAQPEGGVPSTRWSNSSSQPANTNANANTSNAILKREDGGQISEMGSSRFSLPGAFGIDGNGEVFYHPPICQPHLMLGESSTNMNIPMEEVQHHYLPRFGDEPDPSDEFGFLPEPKAYVPRWCCRTLILVIVLIACISVAIVLAVEQHPSNAASMLITMAPSSTPSGEPTWVLVGQIVTGSQEGDKFGRTMAISSDGSTFAASTSSLRSRDYVQVYRLSDDGEEWIKLGDDFETKDQAFVDLAKNGSMVSIATVGIENNSTIGTVELYEWRGSTLTGSWSQTGETIVAREAASRYFGYETKVSEDGKVVVVDDPGANFTTVYSYNGSDWKQVGKQIDRDKSISKWFERDPSGDFSRSSVSISGLGNVVAIGGRDIHRGSFARVYELNQAERWTQRGLDISEFSGESTKDSNIVMSVSLSSDGAVLAIADREFNAAGGEDGVFQINEFHGGEWKERKEVKGSQMSGQLGTSISLSGDGNTCVVGIPFGSGLGRTDVYRKPKGRWLKEGRWLKVGQTIKAIQPEEDVSGDLFGAYVAVASDGRTVAIADENRVKNGSKVGSVSVFRLEYV